MRKAGAQRPILQAAARQFGRLSWTALAVAVVTGVIQVLRLDFPWQDLKWKITLVALAAVLAGVHQFTAAKTSPAVRGVIQAAILVSSIAIFAAAVAL